MLTYSLFLAIYARFSKRSNIETLQVKMTLVWEKKLQIWPSCSTHILMRPTGALTSMFYRRLWGFFYAILCPEYLDANSLISTPKAAKGAYFYGLQFMPADIWKRREKRGFFVGPALYMQDDIECKWDG